MVKNIYLNDEEQEVVNEALLCRIIYLDGLRKEEYKNKNIDQRRIDELNNIINDIEKVRYSKILG